ERTSSSSARSVSSIGVSGSGSCVRYMSTASTPSRERLPSFSRRIRSYDRPRSDGSPVTDQYTFVLSTTGTRRSARHPPTQVSLRPPPYEAAVSKKVTPAAQAASISSNACSRVSPWPNSSGADPMPPKFPQPRPMRESSSGVRPRRRLSMRRAYAVTDYARAMEPEGEDFSQPVLPGEGASDYERYLRTDELLAL